MADVEINRRTDGQKTYEIPRHLSGVDRVGYADDPAATYTAPIKFDLKRSSDNDHKLEPNTGQNHSSCDSASQERDVT